MIRSGKQTATMSTNSVMLLDFDNVFSSLWSLDRHAALAFATEPERWLPLLAERHLTEDHRRWLVMRCYLNPAGFVETDSNSGERLYFTRFRPGLVRAGFEVVDCPSMTRGGKNAADIRMVIDALDLLASPVAYDEFVIASSDSDFAPLLHRIRAAARQIVVICPGYASSAYTCLADRLLDFDALDALVRPGPAEPAGIVVPAGPAQSGDPTQAAFADFVRTRYAEAVAPLNLSGLSQQAARAFPGIKEGGWLGARSFSRALAELQLPHARYNQHYLWDEERHQPPQGNEWGQDAEFPEVVLDLARSFDFPRLPQDAWPDVFAILARYAAEQEFNLTESTRWCRDELAAQGVPVSRAALSFVVRGVQFGGARLDSVNSPAAAEIAAALLANLIERARASGMEWIDEDSADLADWLGIADAPEEQGKEAERSPA
jgi:hypothetical protein